MSGSELIAAERQRQIEVEGFTSKHDDEYEHGELTHAAECYCIAAWTATVRNDAKHFHANGLSIWPWPHSWWRPSDDPIRNLVKAGALIAAEIDRLQRTQPSKQEQP